MFKNKQKTKRKKLANKKSKKDWPVTVIKTNAAILAGILILYLLLGILVDPSFFKRDFKSKFAWAAGAINLVYLGIVNSPPDKPVISQNASCDSQDAYVSLSWGADPKAETFDVYRNGELLFIDFSETTYNDYDVVDNTSYSYYVVAKGIIDNVQSDTVSIITPVCQATPVVPPSEEEISEEEITCQINTLDKINLTKFKCIAKTDRKTPSFSGVANLPYAQINLHLVRIKKDGLKTVLITNTVSNGNGFWYFHLPEQINRGRYYLYATAVDPNDPSRTATVRLRFNAVKISVKKKILTTCWGSLSHKKKKTASKKKATPGISLQVNNNDNSLTSRENLNLTIGKGNFHNDNSVEFRVVAPDESIVYQAYPTPVEVLSDSLNYQIDLPATLPEGNYRIIAKTIYGDFLLSAENYFKFKEAPVINFGGNITLTLGEILASLSAIVIILLGILVLFFSLIFLEYMLAKQRLIGVDENSLKKRGLIS